ncbi:pseudaminic acid cytidylyltransferase [Rheinheimera baltica]|uniref:Pseudaminic acid cytidylyltransferase n=1 Tax=Rheinheimera baltica TaxID=67576 RepID=A0ABT9HUQ5_9GAMM|nr:pseudaminic acid cytidylyltransferase [Rheinheimera baltica]MDP5134855.1 pseudaminic acid cytidylyltransferase [Rheinheimera baltica]
MRIAVIPARGGSKRIPRKNIRFFEGQPIIAWSIQAAITSGCFDKVLVSTDDEEIAAISRQYGADTPFIRPSELADDFSGTADVMRHAIKSVNAAANSIMSASSGVTAACCIYATAPLICPEDIGMGLKQLNNGSCDYALAVTEFEFPIQRAVRLDENNHLVMLNPEFSGTRSQDLVPTFHDAGQFCWGTAEAWLHAKPIYNGMTAAVSIERCRVQDIDNENDWQRAELMFRASRSQNSR